MLFWLPLLIALFGLVLAGLGLRQSLYKQNPFGVTPWLFPAGVFVWGDAVVIGLFWTVLAMTSLVIQNWNFLGLGVALFWVVRAWGEVQYWLHEQFASHHRNEPKNLHFHRYFPGDSIWFVYQVFWQCATVIALLASLFFVWKLFLTT